jgi:hypothetical protein
MSNIDSDAEFTVAKGVLVGASIVVAACVAILMVTFTALLMPTNYYGLDKG